jgi:hypothetical protein
MTPRQENALRKLTNEFKSASVLGEMELTLDHLVELDYAERRSRTPEGYLVNQYRLKLEKEKQE